MSVEGAGILAALFGLPFILAVAIAVIAAKILVVTAAGTVVTVAALARGAGNAAKALAQTGYRVYQEQQDATARTPQETPETCIVSADNYASVRASVQARKLVETRLKKITQRTPEFTPQDRAALASQLALVTAQTAEIKRKPATAWQVPEVPKSVIDPHQVTVSSRDFKKVFSTYFNVLSQLQQQMQELVPNHELTVEVNQLLTEATAKQTSAAIDAKYVIDFVSDVRELHSEGTAVLQIMQQQVEHRAQIVVRINDILKRVDEAQRRGVNLSVNIPTYMRELQQALAINDFAQVETLLTSMDNELQRGNRQHTSQLQENLKLFFADMLRDMQQFGEMVLIDDVHTSSPDEVKDKQRRAACIAWVAAYHKFMDDVAHERISDVAAERDLLEARANLLRDDSIDMAEEVHHGYIAGLFRIALNEVGFPPASDQPVHIYDPIVGYRDDTRVTFQLREDGTFTFSSDGFGDAACKVIYDQVLSKLREYGMRIAETHRWKQAEAVNKIIAALVNMKYRVDFRERGTSIDITATNASGAPVNVSVDADGKHGKLPADVKVEPNKPLRRDRQGGKASSITPAHKIRLRE